MPGLMEVRCINTCEARLQGEGGWGVANSGTAVSVLAG